MPRPADVLLARARQRFALEDYHGAVHLLEEAADTGRAFADVHHLLGVSLSLLGRTERALAELDRALQLNPRYIEALVHRGLVLTDLGRDADAAEAFSRATAELPPPTAGLPAPIAAHLANRHAELADAYAEAGAVNRAIEEYGRALELGPTYHDLRYRMARLLIQVGRSLEAREQLEAVVTASPQFVDAEALLGLAHYLSGDPAGARAVWSTSRERRPENARVDAYLAMLERTAP